MINSEYIGEPVRRSASVGQSLHCGNPRVFSFQDPTMRTCSRTVNQFIPNGHSGTFAVLTFIFLRALSYPKAGSSWFKNRIFLLPTFCGPPQSRVPVAVLNELIIFVSTQATLGPYFCQRHFCLCLVLL